MESLNNADCLTNLLGCSASDWSLIRGNNSQPLHHSTRAFVRCSANQNEKDLYQALASDQKIRSHKYVIVTIVIEAKDVNQITVSPHSSLLSHQHNHRRSDHNQSLRGAGTLPTAVLGLSKRPQQLLVLNGRNRSSVWHCSRLHRIHLLNHYDDSAHCIQIWY